MAAGRHHAVDVNIRIRRTDGKPLNRREAARVLASFRRRLAREDHNPVPPGYELAAINWRRPVGSSRGWVGGDDDAQALRDFHAPMYTAKDDPNAWSIEPSVRLGSVKP